MKGFKDGMKGDEERRAAGEIAAEAGSTIDGEVKDKQKS